MEEESKMVLQTEDLVKKYGKRTVVSHVSINVKQGEIVGLLGPNGAGKTTSFYMTVGLITPNEGRIFLDDLDITKYPVYKRAQTGIGYLAQEASVFRQMSVEDNIAAVLEMTDKPLDYQKDKLESLIAEFRLQKVRKNKGNQLSGGERRRTEIARCLAGEDKMAKITVLTTDINVVSINNEDYICITDMLKAKDGDFFISDWLRNRNTLEYLGIWERLYNPGFNYGEFATIRNQSGLNSFKISVKEYVEKTHAIGIQAKAGRYGGTYAHKDIAFEFGMWISAEFKIYLVREFQRLKEQELAQLGWSAKRELSKINYRIHTDAIKQNLIPAEVTPQQASRIYASEADVLNVAMFGLTALEWRDAHPDLKGNVRDYATVNELICLSNMENLNAVFIGEGLPQHERLVRLNRIAIQQMQILEDVNKKYLK